MNTIIFEFKMQQRVKIVDIDMVGTIDGMMHDSRGNRYRVIFWNDGKRYAEWLYGWELSAKKP